MNTEALHFALMMTLSALIGYGIGLVLAWICAPIVRRLEQRYWARAWKRQNHWGFPE